MGNCFMCFGDNRKTMDKLKSQHREQIDYIKSMHYEETIELHNKIDDQDEQIEILNKKILEVEKRCDQLLLDYYNLEQNYFKCKNELQSCNTRLGSFTSIFSL